MCGRLTAPCTSTSELQDMTIPAISRLRMTLRSGLEIMKITDTIGFVLAHARVDQKWSSSSSHYPAYRRCCANHDMRWYAWQRNCPSKCARSCIVSMYYDKSGPDSLPRASSRIGIGDERDGGKIRTEEFVAARSGWTCAQECMLAGLCRSRFHARFKAKLPKVCDNALSHSA